MCKSPIFLQNIQNLTCQWTHLDTIEQIQLPWYTGSVRNLVQVHTQKYAHVPVMKAFLWHRNAFGGGVQDISFFCLWLTPKGCLIKEVMLSFTTPEPKTNSFHQISIRHSLRHPVHFLINTFIICYSIESRSSSHRQWPSPVTWNNLKHSVQKKYVFLSM